MVREVRGAFSPTVYKPRPPRKRPAGGATVHAVWYGLGEGVQLAMRVAVTRLSGTDRKQFALRHRFAPLALSANERREHRCGEKR